MHITNDMHLVCIFLHNMLCDIYTCVTQYFQYISGKCIKICIRCAFNLQPVINHQRVPLWEYCHYGEHYLAVPSLLQTLCVRRHFGECFLPPKPPGPSFPGDVLIPCLVVIPIPTPPSLCPVLSQTLCGERWHMFHS